MSILSRKIGRKPGGKARAIFAPEMLEEFRLRIEEDLSGHLHAPVTASIGDVGLKVFGDVLQDLPGTLSVGLIDFAGLPRGGMISLDPSMVYHTVELRLGGDPDSEDAPVERAATAFDDGYSVELVSVLCDAFGRACETSLGLDSYLSARVSRLHHALNGLGIVPLDGEALCVSVTVKAGNGGREGRFEICLPLSTIDTMKSGGAKGDGGRWVETDPWFRHMRSTLLDSEVDIDATLYRTEMSVAELSRLDIGQVLRIPAETIGKVPLVLDLTGNEVGVGRLGATAGRRAIRVEKPPEQSFLEPLMRLSRAEREAAA